MYERVANQRNELRTIMYIIFKKEKTAYRRHKKYDERESHITCYFNEYAINMNILFIINLLEDKPVWMISYVVSNPMFGLLLHLHLRKISLHEQI